VTTGRGLPPQNNNNVRAKAQYRNKEAGQKAAGHEAAAKEDGAF